MGDRQGSLNIYFANLGSGSVNRLLPSDFLAVPEASARAQTGLFNNSDSPSSENVRLFEGMATQRAGYTALGSSPGAGLPSTGLFVANFGQGQSFLVQAQAGGGIYRYSEGSGTWIDISGGVVFNATEDQPFTFTMAPRSGTQVANYMLVSSPGDYIYQWDGESDIELLNEDSAPREAHILINFLSRAFAFNVTSPDTGDRYHSRVQRSVVGDSTDWLGLGSGFTDLEDDAFPIANVATIGGRLLILKGDYHGGAMYLATPTGNSVSPLRFDALNPDSGIGLLCPRTLIPLTPGTSAFFLGHDSAYLYGGGAEVVPFATKVTRDIISRVTAGAEVNAWANYNRHTQEIMIGVPVDGSSVVNEVWLLNTRSQQASGPFDYADTFVSTPIAGWTPENPLTWDATNPWGQADPGVDAPRQWQTLVDDAAPGNEYLQWARVLDITGRGDYKYVFGTAAGDIVTSDASDADDDGTAIACTYYTPAITPNGWLVPKSAPSGAYIAPKPQRLRSDDILVLRSVRLRLRGTGARTPVVEVSTDGGTVWTKISDDTAVTPTARITNKTYYCQIPASWHQIRVKNTTGDAFDLQGIEMELTYAGSERHE